VTPLGETLLTALALSGLAAAGLLSLPRTPPRVRFAVAAAGLAAWVVPWGWIRIALPAAAVAPLPFAESLPFTAALEPLRAAASPAPHELVTYAFGAALLLGFVLFAGDCLALRCCLNGLRTNSRSGDELRALLPANLANVPAEIRVVANSTVAAASGYPKATIWIGDRHVGERLRLVLVLVHELWHARSRDPLWLLVLAAVRRAYWWNPLVAYLARQAVLMIESTCDHRSAKHFEESRYVTELASLLLAGATRAPRLMAAAHTKNLNVQRLRLLGTPLRARARDLMLLAVLGASAATAAAATVVERELPLSVGSARGPALPSTPAGAALAALLRAAHAGDSDLLDDLLGAYTPQEVPLPLPRGGGELQVVEVLRSEPRRIEFVLESRTNGMRHAVELEVDSVGTTIVGARLRVVARGRL
jgi:hypothetical protein